MIPYDGLLFFYIMALFLVPAVVLGLTNRSLKRYGLLFTVVMAFVVFNTWEKRAVLLAFYLWETALVLAYLRIRKKNESRPLLWLFVLLAAVPLIITKLGGIIPTFNFLHLLGVSYMTFRAVQVLIETYDGLITEVKLFDFSYFLLFFPSIGSGPIDRYRRFNDDLKETPGRDKYIELLKTGIWKLMWGALFNFVLSSLIYSAWLAPLPDSGFLPTVSYMYGYTFFLFFNFAGYSLMAIGTSYILGVNTPENFNMPFLSRDMKDFWSRWHISLSTWMRDYVYTRYVAAALKGEWYKERRTASYIGYVITMITMGLWHGLSLRYIVYGIYHGILMCINDVLDTRWKRFRKLKRENLPSVLLVFITFHLFSFGLLIFSGRLF
ncbi:MAG: D-alanyl-lipoteichoic acid biosynthesis protein DltB [Clostridiales bacterium]|jgi:membrane protein involved in D-alanine export|nr:D-alanyl-lipoteichoic acid biosynthesis protein DltB [Clostridiales bacterium]